MGYAVHKDPRQVIISTPELELGFSRESGALIVLRRPGGPNYLGHGEGQLSLDVRVASGWMSQRSFARYLSHQIIHEGGATLIKVRVGIGALLVQDCYRVTGTLVARSVSIKNVGLDELQLLGIWMALPSACVGPHESCNFEAPANGCRPRLDLATASQLQRSGMPHPEIVPVVRRGRAFESCPDRGPGLLALHGTADLDSLLCWYFSDQQPAWPAVRLI
jgi:starch synthase (maltosyl-transferring)